MNKMTESDSHLANQSPTDSSDELIKSNNQCGKFNQFGKEEGGCVVHISITHVTMFFTPFLK